MSWGLQVIGKAPAVRKEIALQATKIKCSEPEETVRQAALSAIEAALSAQGDSVVVKVSASGSQGTEYQANGQGPIYNQLTITVDPQHGFVE